MAIAATDDHSGAPLNGVVRSDKLPNGKQQHTTNGHSHGDHHNGGQEGLGVHPGKQRNDGRSKKPQYDPNFTDRVIAATGPNAHPRLVEIMPSLLRHLHDFAREVDLTVAEWMLGVEFINTCGQLSTDRRNETQLLCDILGLESLVDEITSEKLASAGTEARQATSSAVLGPFYRADAPVTPPGGSIVRGLTPAVPWYERAVEDATYIHGRVLPARGGKPIAGAVLDVWHSAPNGLYEQQDAGQTDMNLRGRVHTDALGRFAFYALRPAPYPIPDDGPAGQLLGLLDRGPMRPAHIHFIVTAAGWRPLTTQVFDSRDCHIANDAVFAVKEDLIVDFIPRRGDDKARWTLEYDFVLYEDDDASNDR